MIPMDTDVSVLPLEIDSVEVKPVEAETGVDVELLETSSVQSEILAAEPSIVADLLELESVQAEPLAVESALPDMIELAGGGFGSSLYQALQNYITLDGGRSGDMFTNITPLDGGTA